MIDKKNFFIQPDWPAPQQVKAYTCLRESGVCPSRDEVDKTRLKKLLALNNDPIFLRQTHSTIAVEAKKANHYCEGDGLYSFESNQICAILTADCLPLLVTDRNGQRVAAIHAGWRGLASGVIESTIAALDITPTDCLVWLGPAIGPNKFEVREDVLNAFTSRHPESAHAFIQIGKNHWLANLYSLARLRLQKLGIQQVYGGEYCTYSDPISFYSYRRDGQETGRLVSLIWIEDSLDKM